MSLAFCGLPVADRYSNCAKGYIYGRKVTPDMRTAMQQAAGTQPSGLVATAAGTIDLVPMISSGNPLTAN